jgi:hypothetical protein
VGQKEKSARVCAKRTRTRLFQDLGHSWHVNVWAGAESGVTECGGRSALLTTSGKHGALYAKDRDIPMSAVLSGSGPGILGSESCRPTQSLRLMSPTTRLGAALDFSQGRGTTKKPFVKASTISLFHMPLNMGSTFARTWDAIRSAHADDGGFLVLSHDDSAWHAEHLFAVAKDLPGAEMVQLSGNFLTKVFEGPYSDAKKWCTEMERYVQAKGKALDTLYFFYTTCPKCAKHYGKNYVVGVAKVR